MALPSLPAETTLVAFFTFGKDNICDSKLWTAIVATNVFCNDCKDPLGENQKLLSIA
jgi:hypothetical protein